MVRTVRINSSFPFFDEASIQGILKDIESTLKSGVLADGPHVGEFEKEFARYVGSKYAVAVNSGTSALEIMLRFLNVKMREVIVPTNTFVATPSSVLLAGGKPVFADMDEKTLCIDLNDVEKRITPKTKGIIAVHIAGLICPRIKELRSFCRENNLFLLEDAAHAHGASISGEMAGNLCDGGAFSFYPSKVMTTGHGGMITTNDSNMDAAARNMRNHGIDTERLMTIIGSNWCMSEVTAIMGRYQLAHLEDFICKRNDIARYYEDCLKDTPYVSLFKTPQGIRHSYYKYPIRLEDHINVNRLMEILKNEFGIETGSVYYPPCHLHPWYKRNFTIRNGDLSVSETVLKQVLCLPMHMGMTNEVAQYVIDALQASICKLQD
jgi:perosamine synthetase